jgi:Ca2+-transporting ATPase
MSKDPASSETKWHNLNADEVLARLGVDRNGLSSVEARERLMKFGPNQLVEKKKISPLAILIEQFKSLLIIILIAAAVLSGVLGEVADSIIIIVIVVLAAGLGFVQEYKAERALEALKKMAAPFASVIRDGKEQEIPASELVPGDIILIATGDKIPADARVIESVNLKVDEAPLTGESVPVGKTKDSIQEDVPVGDRKNMVYMGTAAVYGRGTAVVTATGMMSKFGKIAKMLQEVEEEKTPLQVSLDKMGKWLAIGAMFLCISLAGIGVLRGHGILEMLLWGVSLIVAAVPECLPAVVTISLALGVHRMVKCHALIRRLAAVETLGCTTVICSDKTGTLTQNQMTVRKVYADGRLFDISGSGYEPKGEFRVQGRVVDPKQDKVIQTLLTAAALCNDASLVCENGEWRVKGDPTEGALVVLLEKAGLSHKELVEKYPRIGEIPFTSETKRMTTVHQIGNERIAYSKGAPEVVLKMCNRVLTETGEKELSESEKNRILEESQKMAAQALRLLGLAYKKIPSEETISERIENDMVFIGLVAMIDPPREEVKDSIKLCEEAGIKSVMITGDHKLTAEAIANELGLMKGGIAITGEELDAISDKEFESKVEDIRVYARVSPSHKLRVVEAFSKKGHTVAMTGDGVNDAPALKRADIGVAMGITGTDVSKEAADMVLTDDNFASIVAAVKEGRVIFSNIKKYLVYLLSCNLGEILVVAMSVLLGPFLGIPAGILPLVAIQILYINLATDGLPAIALSVDPSEPGIMRRKPRRKGENFFTPQVIKYIVIVGIWTGLVCFGIFIWALNRGRSNEEAQCLCFISLILIQFFNAFNCRSLDRSLFNVGIFKNRWLVIAVIWECTLLSLIVYMPFLQKSFHTYSLTFRDWAIVIFTASTVFIFVEIAKLLKLFGKSDAVCSAK